MNLPVGGDSVAESAVGPLVSQLGAAEILLEGQVQSGRQIGPLISHLEATCCTMRVMAGNKFDLSKPPQMRQPGGTKASARHESDNRIGSKAGGRNNTPTKNYGTVKGKR